MRKAILLLFLMINIGHGAPLEEMTQDDEFSKAVRPRKPKNIFDQEIMLREEIKEQSSVKTIDPYTQEEYDRIKDETNSREDFAAWYLEKESATDAKLEDALEELLNRTRNTNEYENKVLSLNNIMKNLSLSNDEKYQEQRAKRFSSLLAQQDKYRAELFLGANVDLLESNKETTNEVITFDNLTMIFTRRSLPYIKRCFSDQVQYALNQISDQSFSTYLEGLNTKEFHLNFVEVEGDESSITVDVSFEKGSETRGKLIQRHELKGVSINSQYFKHPHVNSDPKFMYTARNITKRSDLCISKAAGAAKCHKYSADLVVEEYATKTRPTTTNIEVIIPINTSKVSQCIATIQASEMEQDDLIHDPIGQARCKIVN